jgi:hypothetical protein
MVTFEQIARMDDRSLGREVMCAIYQHDEVGVTNAELLQRHFGVSVAWPASSEMRTVVANVRAAFLRQFLSERCGQ